MYYYYGKYLKNIISILIFIIFCSSLASYNVLVAMAIRHTVIHVVALATVNFSPKNTTRD